MATRVARQPTALAAALCLFLIRCETAAEDALLEYRNCLSDDRDGIYWNLSGVSCNYTHENAEKEIQCHYRGVGAVSVTYVNISTLNVSESYTGLCEHARRIETSNDGESFTMDLDPQKGLPRLVRAPTKYFQWRSWLQLVSPLSISIREAAEPLPSFRGCDKLRSFSLSDSLDFFPVDNATHGLLMPDLPPSVEEISFEDGRLWTIPNPGKNTLPLLKKLNLSHNRIGARTEMSFLLPTPYTPNLEVLDLSHNAIGRLVQGFGSFFPDLKWLDLSHNRLANFHWSIQFPRKVTFFNVSHNTGGKLFSFLGNRLPLLETLDVSYTRPKYKRDEILQWEVYGEHLKNLHVSGYDNVLLFNLTLNRLTMKMEYGLMPCLYNITTKYLDLSGGNIETISNLPLNGSTNKYFNISASVIKPVQRIPNRRLGRVRADVLDLSGNRVSAWDDARAFRSADGALWVHELNLSHNALRFMHEPMLQSLSALSAVHLDANPFECANCNISSFQDWLTQHQALTHSPYCGSPDTMRSTLVSDQDFHWRYCAPNMFLLTILCGIGAFVALQCLLLFFFRHKIAFIQKLYILLKRQSTVDDTRKYTHDVFIYYSSADRDFVMEVLAPFVEDGPERYKAYIHERSFTLGADIAVNIVEAIERSRRALLVLSQDFLKSHYCKKEFDMVTHRAFDGGGGGGGGGAGAGYMVLLRYGPLSKHELPRALRLYMTTKTYLEWPDDPSQVTRLQFQMRQWLVEALGQSLYQRTHQMSAEDGHSIL